MLFQNDYKCYKITLVQDEQFPISLDTALLVGVTCSLILTKICLS